MDNSKINTREIIADMLLEVVRNNTHSHILLKNVLDKYNYIEENDKAFIKRIFEGVLERELTLDYILNKYSNTPVNKMKPYIRCLMRMSTYQIVYMDRVPDSAAINEAVKLAKKHKFVNLSGFVNGVLRKIASNKDNAVDTEDMSVVYSANSIIVDSLTKDYGIEKTKQILDESLKRHNVCVRIREDISEDKVSEVINEWNKEHISYRRLDELKYAYIIENTDNIGRLKCFQNGFFTVQDMASMMVCEYAGIEKGMKVLDVCASPGGKSLHAISKGATVEARDVSDYKVSMIEENAKRLAVNIDTKVWDATVFDEAAVESADIVIADVPCSGFGVIGKKPDIKRNITEEGLMSITTLQQEIIDNVWQYVRKNGVLMYSTCTLRKAENENQVKYITDNYPFEVIKMETLYPCEEHDGFFIARLKRIG